MRTSGSRRVLLVIAAMVVLPLSALAAGDGGEYLGDGHVDPGEGDAAELARAVQNPVADLISLPFQNNTNFEFGPKEKTLNRLTSSPLSRSGSTTTGR